jgi:putative ABC transport system permease protein
VLTLACVVVTFLLFGALWGITSAFDSVVADMNPNRMRVQSRASLFASLPVSYMNTIERIPGVSDLGYVVVFNATYQTAANRISAYAISDKVLASKLDFTLKPEYEEALFNTRTGAIVGSRLAQRYGWKVGDKIPLKSGMWARRDGTDTWTFDIVGIYEVQEHEEIASEVYFNYDYLDQERVVLKGTAHLFVLGADRPAQVAAAIDAAFANSSNPTITERESDWMRSQMKQVGDIEVVIKSVLGAAFFALLFLIGNTMMYSVRERIGEIATLRAIGYSTRNVMALITGEATIICLLGCAIGLGIAAVLFGPASEAMQAPLSMPPMVLVVGALAALFTALVSSVLPAFWANRLDVVDALRKR